MHGQDQQLQQIVDKTIMEGDHDRDGKLSFEEFASMVSNTVGYRPLATFIHVLKHGTGYCEANDTRGSLLVPHRPKRFGWLKYRVHTVPLYIPPLTRSASYIPVRWHPAATSSDSRNRFAVMYYPCLYVSCLLWFLTVTLSC